MTTVKPRGLKRGALIVLCRLLETDTRDDLFEAFEGALFAVDDGAEFFCFVSMKRARSPSNNDFEASVTFSKRKRYCSGRAWEEAEWISPPFVDFALA